jgi:hypothetical protein
MSSQDEFEDASPADPGCSDDDDFDPTDMLYELSRDK